MTTDHTIERDPNVELLDLVLAQITAYPETWKQNHYRCGTSYCFAGHAAVIAGGQWANPADKTCSLLLAEADDEGVADVWAESVGRPDSSDGGVVADYPVANVVECDDRARRLLGLTVDEADALFAGGNRLERLYELCEQIKARAPMAVLS